jgi:hypothetical protein
MKISDKKVIRGSDIKIPAILGDFFSAITVIEAIRMLPDMK